MPDSVLPQVPDSLLTCARPGAGPCWLGLPDRPSSGRCGRAGAGAGGVVVDDLPWLDRASAVVLGVVAARGSTESSPAGLLGAGPAGTPWAAGPSRPRQTGLAGGGWPAYASRVASREGAGSHGQDRDCRCWVVGLGAGLLLCGDGHEVTVLERTPRRRRRGLRRSGVAGSVRGQPVPASALLPGPLPRPPGLRTARGEGGIGRCGSRSPNPVLTPPRRSGPVREEDGAFECISGRRAWWRQPSRRWPTGLRIWRSEEAPPSRGSSPGRQLTTACLTLPGFGWARARR